MADHHALGRPGRARGVLQKGDVVRRAGRRGAADGFGRALIGSSSTASHLMPAHRVRGRERIAQIAALAIDSALGASARRGLQSARMPPLALRALLRRGTIIGTAATPPHATENPTRQSIPFGQTSRARSPGSARLSRSLRARPPRGGRVPRRRSAPLPAAIWTARHRRGPSGCVAARCRSRAVSEVLSAGNERRSRRGQSPDSRHPGYSAPCA